MLDTLKDAAEDDDEASPATKGKKANKDEETTEESDLEDWKEHDSRPLRLARRLGP